VLTAITWLVAATHLNIEAWCALLCSHAINRAVCASEGMAEEWCTTLWLSTAMRIASLLAPSLLVRAN
jgi:hypothetical protein